MAEHVLFRSSIWLNLDTEKAFLKQPKVFPGSQKSSKGKRPGKGRNCFWKALDWVSNPREAIQGCILAGTCYSAKMIRSIVVRQNCLHFVKKYQSYEKRHSNISARISSCFHVREGDHVIIVQCRPLSKTVRFNVLKVIPAGSSGCGKKAVTAILWGNNATAPLTSIGGLQKAT